MTKIITNIQVHKIALDTLKKIEDKWNNYIKENVRRSLAFDEQKE